MTRLALVHYGEMAAALEAVPGILEVEPSAIELMDKMLLDMTRAHPDYSRHLTFIEGDPAAVLISSMASRRANLRRRWTGCAIARAQGHREQVVIADTESRARDVLIVRKAGLGLLMSMRGCRSLSRSSRMRRFRSSTLPHTSRAWSGSSRRTAHGWRSRARQRGLPAHPPAAEFEDRRACGNTGRSLRRSATWC